MRVFGPSHSNFQHLYIFWDCAADHENVFSCENTVGVDSPLKTVVLELKVHGVKAHDHKFCFVEHSGKIPKHSGTEISTFLNNVNEITFISY